MVVKKCDKCLRRFRTSKEKEPLCARCTVDNLPKVEDVAKMEAEFNGFAQQIYGTRDPQAMPLLFHVDNVFNHKSRLNALKELNDKEKSHTSTKERQKANREVNRLSEESTAIHDKIRSMKDSLMSVMMLASTIKQGDGSATAKTTSRRPAEDRVDGRIGGGANAVSNIRNGPSAAPTMMPDTGKKKEPSPPKREEFVSELKRSPSEVESATEDELLALKRSNSVRNRILELQQKTGREVNRLGVEESPAIAQFPINNGIIGKDIGGGGDNMMSVTITMQPVPLARSGGGGSFLGGNVGGMGDAGHHDLVKKKIKESPKEEVEIEEVELLPSDPEEDELMPLKRSNSVRNRIQAFEALSRRASTGTYDRGASPRRKLHF